MTPKKDKTSITLYQILEIVISDNIQAISDTFGVRIENIKMDWIDVADIGKHDFRLRELKLEYKTLPGITNE